MLKLSSSKGIRIDVPVLSVSWSVEDHSVIIQALRKGLIEHEASDTGGVPRWKSSCPDRLAEATDHYYTGNIIRVAAAEKTFFFKNMKEKHSRYRIVIKQARPLNDLQLFAVRSLNGRRPFRLPESKK